MKRRNFLKYAIAPPLLASTVSVNSNSFLSNILSTKKEKKTCHPNLCFDSDFDRFGYRKFYNSIYELAKENKLSGQVKTGPTLLPHAHRLFYSKNLYNIDSDSLQLRKYSSSISHDIYLVNARLECGVPIRGLLSIPDKDPSALVYLAHGFASTPERCFDEDYPDYMNAIGERLSRTGFAVWCPFLPHGGNNPSLTSLAAMLATRKISLLNILCSTLNLGYSIYSNTFSVGEQVKILQYGVSFGVSEALFLMVGRGKKWPTVLSNGSFVDKSESLSSDKFANNAGRALRPFFMTNLDIYPFLFPQVLEKVFPAPLFFEFGLDITSGKEKELINIFKEYYKKNGIEGNTIDFDNFEGGHEAYGVNALNWLLKFSSN